MSNVCDILGYRVCQMFGDISEYRVCQIFVIF